MIIKSVYMTDVVGNPIPWNWKFGRAEFHRGADVLSVSVTADSGHIRFDTLCNENRDTIGYEISVKTIGDTVEAGELYLGRLHGLTSAIEYYAYMKERE